MSGTLEVGKENGKSDNEEIGKLKIWGQISEEKGNVKKTVESRDEEKEPVDQHPDKGLLPGSSFDGLSQGMVTGTTEEGRQEEGEEARRPASLPAPVYVSKAERQEHELTHTHTISLMVSALCSMPWAQRSASEEGGRG